MTTQTLNWYAPMDRVAYKKELAYVEGILKELRRAGQYRKACRRGTR